MSALHLSLRLATRLLEAAIALVVVAYLLLGAGLLTLRYAVLPNAQQFVPWLQRASSRALGLPVHIGSVQGSWQGLLPVLSIHDLVIDDARGKPALRLAAVQAIPSWKSLPRLQLSFEQLAIRGADLRVTRVDADHVDIGGIALNLRGGGAGAGQRFADWLFSQDQILVRDSRITWIDRTRSAPPLQLRDVQFELRNALLRHRAALQALPPPALGGLLSVRADMEQPLFDRHPGNLAAWHGLLWADLRRVDLDSLAQWVSLPGQLAGGQGALRAWLQLGRDYTPQSLTVAAALGRVSARLGAALPPLQLGELAGRLQWQRLPHGQQVEVIGLRLRDARGDLLAPTRLLWRRQGLPGQPGQGSVSCSGLDLGVLDRLAQDFPLPVAWRARLQLLQPHGRLQRASLSWSGRPAAGALLPPRYALQMDFSALGWNSPATRPSDADDPLAQARDAAGLPAALPGVQGLSGTLDANQDGGNARLRMQDGSVALPTVFESPSLPLRSLDARLSWSRAANGQWDVQGSQIRLRNADAAGSVDLRYTTQPHGPGLLDLSARLSRADARAVPTYLPRGVGQATRDYLRRAIVGGSSRDVHMVVQGPLARFPFVQPGSGVFEVDARIENGVFDAQPGGDAKARPAWPLFRDIDGRFGFSSRGMTARGLSARVSGIALQGVQLELADYARPLLHAQGDLRGQAGDALRFLRDSPLDQALGHALTRSRASGALRGQLSLSLPLQGPQPARVRGRVQLLDDRVEYLPWLPPMDGVQGQVDFTERSFNLQLAARDFAGGALQLHGSLAGGGGLRLQASGQMRAAALQALPQWAAWKPWLDRLHGGAPFTLQVSSQPGQAQPRIELRSSLQGMAVDLPAPLGKTAQAGGALRLDLSGGGAGPRRVDLEFGNSLRLRGSLSDGAAGQGAGLLGLGIAVGAQAALPQPAQGVQVNLVLPSLDLDKWRRALPATGAAAAPGAPGASSPAPAAPQPGAVSAGASALDRWLPQAVSLQVGQLTVADRVFDHVVLGATRAGSLWQANLRSSQLEGAVDWRMGRGDAPGSIRARLSRLRLPESADSDVEHLLDQRVRSLPALDLQARDVDIHGHHFDSLQLRAVNRGRGAARQWDLTDVRLSSGDALLSASGNWSPAAAGDSARHRMSLGFKLDVADAGALLARLGKPGLLKGGKGVLQGTLTWLGSPLALDYPTLSGQFSLQLGKGQFLKADQGLAKLLGVLSLQSLPRRLMFNFSDVFASGFAFDRVDADVQLLDGVATTNDFKMAGLSATVFIDGSADLARETQDLYVVVVPDINAGSASLAYALINPAIGLGTFIAQLIAREPLMKALTYGYRITGTWDHPKVTPQHEPHVPAAAARATAP